MSQPHFPYRDGDVAVLGPEVFASADGMTISWKGANYRRDHGQPEDVSGRVREAVAILEDEMATAQRAGHELAAYVLKGAILRINTALKESAPAATEATDGPACRYCGADCSNGRSWDGGDLYACGPCANDRAAVNGAGGNFDALVQRVRDRHVAEEHAEQPEPATITDPEYLRRLYAEAIAATPARYPDDIATAIMRVRDGYVQQLRQRLRLADELLATRDAGPSVAECAEADRRWPLEKHGE